MQKNFIKIFLVIFLQSCSSTWDRPRVSILDDKDEATVIARVSGKKENVGGGFEEVMVQTTWCTIDKYCLHLDSKEKLTDNGSFGNLQNRAINNSHLILTANPGKYYLVKVDEVSDYPDWTFIALYPFNVIRSLTFNLSSTFKSDDRYYYDNDFAENNFASFEIKSGETVYLADLNFTFEEKGGFGPSSNDGKTSLLVNDYLFEQAKEEFFDRIPGSKEVKINQRSIILGNLLDNYEAGEF